MIVVWIKKNYTLFCCYTNFLIVQIQRYIFISIFFYVYVYKTKVKFPWQLQTRSKNLLVLFKYHVTSRDFLNLKKTIHKLSISHFFFQKKVFSELTYDKQNRYLNRRKAVYAFVPCSLHCYSGTRKKILLYRLQFLKRNSSRRIVGDWEISCKQI